MDAHAGTASPQPYRAVKIALGVLGALTLACGATAVFVTANDAGAASLVIAGAAMIALGVLIERISWVKAGPVELQLLELARIQAETAAAVEAGDRERAARLSEEAATLVASVSPLAARFQRIRGAPPERASTAHESDAPGGDGTARR